MKLSPLATPGHLIGMASRGFAKLGERRLKPLGFGPGVLPVLVALRDGHASTQRDLARLMRVEQPPMAQMLARMERDGLIERRVDLTDRRSRTIALRPEAAARLPRAIDAMIEGNRDALHGLTDDEATQLLALLGRVVDNLDRLTRDAPPTA